MIQVTVRFFGPFRELFGARGKTIDLPEGQSVRGLLERLCDNPERQRQAYSAAAGLSPYIVVMINGEPAPPAQGLDIPVRDGDVVAIFPFLGGG